MSTLETGKKVVERLTGWSGPPRTRCRRLYANASREPTALRMMVSFLITRIGHWCSFALPFACPRMLIPPPFLKTFLSKMAGAIPGATASMTMSTIIRAFMRCWE